MKRLTKQLPIISRHEYVQIAGHTVEDIPAKIDTGADSSAIWASNIREVKDELVFELFGEGSVYYTGDKIKTKEYKVKKVKNSFGEEELRYMVKLSIVLGGNRYKVFFSLANRQRNHFPILIGRRFLHKKFLVNVATTYKLSKQTKIITKKILVITSKQTKEKEDFFEEVGRQAGAEVRVCSYKDLVFICGKVPKVYIADTREDISEFGLVYFRTHRKNPEMASSIAQYLKYQNIPFFDEELSDTVSSSKLSQMMRLSCHGVRTPMSICSNNNWLKKNKLKLFEQLGSPFVLKEIHSERGKHNYLISGEEEFDKIINKAKPDQVFMAQKYIPNDGFSRVLVLGVDARYIANRKAIGNDNPLKAHINKPTGGVNVKYIKPSKFSGVATSLAIKSAVVMRRQVAGIDIIQDNQTGKWYVIEVNSSPQMINDKLAGKKAKLMANFLKQELGKL